MGIESDLTVARYEREKSGRVDLFIGGPKPVMDAFLRFQQREGHASYWAALEDLLRRADALKRGGGRARELSVTMKSGAFVKHMKAAKEAAERGPVVVLEYNHPAYVLVSYREFSRLTEFRENILGLLHDLEN